jgi:hypothetical protein
MATSPPRCIAATAAPAIALAKPPLGTAQRWVQAGGAGLARARPGPAHNRQGWPAQATRRVANCSPAAHVAPAFPGSRSLSGCHSTAQERRHDALSRCGVAIARVRARARSARGRAPAPDGQAQRQVLYLASAGKPLRSKPYRGLPRPGLVVGDQLPTDGLLARRLGYGFVHYQPDLPGTPRGPRAMRMLGHTLRPILFTS